MNQKVTLYDDGHHRCISFTGLVQGEGIQSNQFLILHGEHAAVIDPGGELTYVPLTMALSRYVRPENLDLILASHQDPDIISALGNWVKRTPAKVAISRLWSRFVPHLSSAFAQSREGSNIFERVLPIEDAGGLIPLGDMHIHAIPAHFLHSVGNFQFYDPVSKILFSGDMGASVVEDVNGPVPDFKAHIPHMEGFHRRYMASNKVCRLWADMVRGLDIDKMVPQHGPCFTGEQVGQFLDWISQLECGVDLMDASHYSLPEQPIGG